MQIFWKIILLNFKNKLHLLTISYVHDLSKRTMTIPMIFKKYLKI